MEIVTTADGSKTLFHEGIGENYHSKHGAYRESKHVFIQMGLEYALQKNPDNNFINILEIGFGTGLNFLFSMEHMKDNPVHLKYSSVEAYPLKLEKIKSLDYSSEVDSQIWDAFENVYEESMQSRKWRKVLPQIDLKIYQEKVQDCKWEDEYDVIYFDAFAAIHQPEMWSRETLEIVVKNLKSGGCFVTYAITGELKRNMKSLGFQIEKLPGAPGKREMLRAIKI